MSNPLSPSRPAAPLIAAAATGLPPRKQLWLRSSAQQTSLYFRQMHALLHAGMSLALALDEMSRSAPSRGLRRASSAMGQGVGAGKPWSQLMRGYPGLFSELTIAFIGVGEGSGSLEQMCLRLSEYAENEYHIQQTIKNETWYPKLLLLISTILPIRLVFGEHSYTLGTGTQLGLIVAAWAGWKGANFLWPIGANAGRPRHTIDSIKLHAPLAGPTVRTLATAKFCRSLGLLWATGLGLSRTLSMAADACGNAIIASNIRGATPRLQGGGTISEALASTGEMPGSVLQMMHAGEASGTLDEMLQKAAGLLEEQARTSLHQAVTTFNLIVFLIVAFKVAVQVIQFWAG